MASSSSGGYVSRYDVFLSFRGETRNKFTDHLYDKLLRAGVFTFRDNDAIPRGEELTPGIVRGIRESRASIIVLSELYATSRWCLDELCLILEQRRDRNHYVLPIFYHVDPSHVRKQEGTFEINVAPKKKWTEDKVERWKAALEKVGNMTGEVASSSRPETKLLEDIVDIIRKRLDLKQVYRQANLVGMENQDKEINSWLEQSDSDILAIWGMDGGGKTTLSRHIAYSNWKKFDSVCIIEDIASRPPEGLRQLQEKLIKDIIEGKEQTNPSSWQCTYTIENALERRKALIILDNIVTKKQLEALIGIGTGTNTQSKIIITTEKSGSSKWFKSPSWGCQEYEMKLLNNEDSYKLLKLHAFEPDDPTEDYEELANKVLQYCQGHPLALEVLGSCLKDDKRKDVWDSRFKSFERELHGDIKKVLRIRYDSLPLGSDRSLFLHIACFFIGKNKDFVGKILEPDYSAISGIITLTKSCLLFVSPNNKLMMHPLLKEMGRTIVYDESPLRPGKRSRIWRNEDSHDVLINKKGSTKVEGLALDMEILSKEHGQLLNLKTDSFKKMNYLKLLKLNQLERVTGSYNKFSKNLRWLCWRDFRLDKIPPKLDMGKLVAIDMSCSKLEVFEPPKVLESLKFLNLKESDNLEKIENISRLPNLQKLNLQNCGALVRVRDTLGDLSSITLLNLTGCKNLCKRAKLSGDNRNQPYFLLPNSLKRLLLMGCNLEDTHYFPLNFKDQPLLEYMNLAYNPVELLPTYTHLYNLRVLDLSCCSALKKLLCLPRKLAELYIFHCISLETVTFESHKYNLQEFRYEGCVNLSVVEDFFKFFPVAMLTEADLGHMSWLRLYQDHEVSLVGDDDLTKGRSLCLHMLYEFNIMSVSLPNIQKQNLTSEYEYTSEHGFLSFSVPKSPRNRRLKGLNLTFKYTIQGDTWVWFAKIKTNKGVDLIYNPNVFGKPASNEVGVWISYWPIGESLQDKDVVDVAIVVMIGLEIQGCGASLVYTDDEDETESFEDNDVTMVDANTIFEDNNNTFEDSNDHADILGADISGFKLSTGTYYLCRRDYSEFMEVGRLTPNWFYNLVGDTIDYTEIGGWRKTGRPDQPYRSYTELKTVRCIIYGPELEEIYKIAESTKASLLDATVEAADIDRTTESTSSSLIEKKEYTGSDLSRSSIQMKQDTNSSREKMNQNIGTEMRQSASNMFNSEVELSKFLGSLDALPNAYHAILETSLTFQLHQDSGINILAFTVTPDFTARFLEGEFDLVSSETHQVVDFISTKVNPLFSINKAAVDLFEQYFENLSVLGHQLTYEQLIVTGKSLGGYLAILFTLWLQHDIDLKESNGHRNNKRPICITFGSPLVGDEALQLAIRERPTWKSSFLNIVTKKDPVATLFSSKTSYKPFGTFLFCTESGSNSVFEDPELILAVLDSMGSSNAGNLGMSDYGNDLREIRRKILYRGVSESGELYLNSFRAGITLQLKEVGVSDNISENLIGRMEEEQAEMMRSNNIYESIKKLNDMKICMTYMEWYMKTSRSKAGYYDRYKNPYSKEDIESKQVILKNQRLLNQYWRKIVQENNLMPKQEGATLRKRWLYAGTTYRRIVEPLEIADYYYNYGKTNYVNERPFHYQLLEKWLNEDREVSNPSDRKKSKAVSLNEDSCFWAHVEEALISLRGLRKGGSSENALILELQLEKFEDYLMLAIEDYKVSPDIFLEGSSLMKWWNEYKEYRGDSYASEFANFMNNKSYMSYE